MIYHSSFSLHPREMNWHALSLHDGPRKEQVLSVVVEVAHPDGRVVLKSVTLSSRGRSLIDGDSPPRRRHVLRLRAGRVLAEPRDRLVIGLTNGTDDALRGYITLRTRRLL